MRTMQFANRKTEAGRRTIAAVGALIGAVLTIVAGCNSKTTANNANFTQALNAYFMNHPECLFPDAPHFPYEATTREEMREMDGLVSAKLLIVLKAPTMHMNRYSVTPAGARAAPRFCYGYRAVASIDSFTPPAKANGFIESQVTYHYSIKDVPVWADTQQVRSAFPAMAKAIGTQSSAKITLAQTMVGWQVPE